MSDNRTVDERLLKLASMFIDKIESVHGTGWILNRESIVNGIAGFASVYLDEQTASLREENEKLKSEAKEQYSAGLMCERILAKDQIKQLQEEVERLRGTLLKVRPYLAATGTNGNHWLPEIDKALSSKESKPS